jgi:hypothetical protein
MGQIIKILLWSFVEIFFIDFLDDFLGLFIKEKPTFTNNLTDFSVALLSVVWRDFMAVEMKNFVRPIFERCFQVRDFSFWITEEISLTGVSFHF